MKALFSALVVSLLAVSSPAFAQEVERKDLQVFNDIADQVNRYTQLTIFDSISASVDDGRVVLTFIAAIWFVKSRKTAGP